MRTLIRLAPIRLALGLIALGLTALGLASAPALGQPSAAGIIECPASPAARPGDEAPRHVQRDKYAIEPQSTCAQRGPAPPVPQDSLVPPPSPRTRLMG